MVGGGGSRGAGRVGRGVEVVMRGVQVGVRGVGIESVQVGWPGLLTDVLVHWVLVTIYGVVDHGGDCPLDWRLRLAYWKNGRSLLLCVHRLVPVVHCIVCIVCISIQ